MNIISRPEDTDHARPAEYHCAEHQSGRTQREDRKTPLKHPPCRLPKYRVKDGNVKC